MSGISGDFDNEPRRLRRSTKERDELAKLHSQLEGGEFEDHLSDVNHDDAREYDDSDLIRQGLRQVATYKYTDPKGHVLYEVVRYEHSSIPGFKKFKYRSPGLVTGFWVSGGGPFKVPYRWKELTDRPDETVFFVEGEKDVDRLINEGLLATTLASQGWSNEAVRALNGRDVVIIPDNDSKGRENADKAAARLRGFAASLRLLDLPDLARTGDVSDWLDAGHTTAELKAAAASARPTEIQATSTGWIDSTTLPRRSWLYRPHYARQFVSNLIAPGGVGKSSLALVEVLAMVTGKPLLGITPEKRLRAWYWNGEDPLEELQRRVAAVIKHYGLKADDIGDSLFLNSGRTMPIIVAQMDARTVRVNDAVISELTATILTNKIDVVVIDPYVAVHRVPENLNTEMELVAKTFSRLADVTNCSVMLVHHTRKTNGNETTVEDARGASALHAAARNARAINTMTKQEAAKAQVQERDRRLYFRTYMGKNNLTRPAEADDWFKLVSVDLGNTKGVDWDQGDHVGVVTPWRYPTPQPMTITSADIRRVQAIIKTDGPFRLDQRAAKEPWVGIAIARALTLDISIPIEKKRIGKLVEAWLAAGWITVVTRKNAAARKDYDYVEVGNAPVDPTGAASQSGND